MKAKKLTTVLMTVVCALGLGACAARYEPEDAVAYVQAALDASYKADFEEYVELTDSTKKEAEKMYQQNVDNVMTGIGVENLGISDELTEQYKSLAPDLLALAEYEVTGAEEDGEGFTVTVSYKPFTGFNDLEGRMMSAVEEMSASLSEMPTEDEINELVYQSMYDIIQQCISEPAYGEAQDFTIHITKDDNVYRISEDDLINLDYAMFPGE